MNAQLPISGRSGRTSDCFYRRSRVIAPPLDAEVATLREPAGCLKPENVRIVASSEREGRRKCPLTRCANEIGGANRRSLQAGRFGLVLCLLLGLTSAFGTPVRAGDEELVEAGRSAGRAILILRDPWPCSIALIRARCQADITHFLGGRGDNDFTSIPNVGPHPVSGLQAFLARGDRDGFDRSLSYIDAVFAPASLWSSDARAATLFDIGALQISVPAALDDPVRTLFALGPAIDLSKQKSSLRATEFQSDLTTFAKAAAEKPSASPVDVASAARILVDASLRQYPPPLLRSFPATQRPSDFALYGVVGAWISQFNDNPSWLAQPDVVALANGWIARSIALAPALESTAQPFADSLRARPYDHARVLQSSMALAMGVQRAGSQERAREIAVGSASAQLTYNAAVLRNPDAARTMLQALSTISELDTDIPDFARLRKTAAAIRSDDWAAQFSLGNALVAAIIAP